MEAARRVTREKEQVLNERNKMSEPFGEVITYMYYSTSRIEHLNSLFILQLVLSSLFILQLAEGCF